MRSSCIFLLISISKEGNANSDLCSWFRITEANTERKIVPVIVKTKQNKASYSTHTLCFSRKGFVLQDEHKLQEVIGEKMSKHCLSWTVEEVEKKKISHIKSVQKPPSVSRLRRARRRLNICCCLSCIWKHYYIITLL